MNKSNNSGNASSSTTFTPPVTVVDAGPGPTPDASTTCAFGTDLCGGACIDVLFDAKNCGSCGNVCGGGTSCVRGLCM